MVDLTETDLGLIRFVPCLENALRLRLALDGRTPVTRFTRLPIRAIPWPQDRPLHLLFTGASPATLLRLDTAAEWADVQRALAPVVAAGRIEAKAIPQGATLADLPCAAGSICGTSPATEPTRDHLRRRWRPGDAGGGRDPGPTAGRRGGAPSGAQRLPRGAGGGRAASVAGALLRADVPAVVAMQADVSDVAAGAFAAAFFDAIAVGQTRA